MVKRWVIATSLLAAGSLWAKPPAPAVFCSKYPTAPVCTGGQPSCSYCHTSPPTRNVFGTAIEANLAVGAARPLSDGDYSLALPAALSAVEPMDSDGDMVSNLTEIQKATLPAEIRSFPNDVPCAGGHNPQYQVCKYDWRYVFRKVHLDFCGASPNYAQLTAFMAVADGSKPVALDAELDTCLRSEFWRGKNGQLWELANKKIRPVGALKAGNEDQGFIPLADYYDDYALWAWSQIDGNDARDVLTANFFVQRSAPPTAYTKTQFAYQAVDVGHRVGNLSTAWSLVYNIMFTSLPRNAAAHAYRSYLGLDIAKQEGLYPVASEPKDYDGKGVTQELCTQCHATLDPLSYPFRNYNGLTGGNNQLARYIPMRIETFFSNEAPNITQMPERGSILGQSVNTLAEWGQVAANSDAFAVATVGEYWKLLFGAPPTPEQNAQFVELWRGLKTTHNYSVENMLHALVRTEAYGAP